MANPKTLIPGKLTVEEASKLGAKGGKASVEARRKKKLMSQIYGEFLAERFRVEVDGEEVTHTGETLVNAVVKKVLLKGGSSAVSLMKEIREATEGTNANVHLDGDLTVSSMTDEEVYAEAERIIRDGQSNPRGSSDKKGKE